MALHRKQVIINLEVSKPPRDGEEVTHFLAFLIKRVNMSIAKSPDIPKNPIGYYCDTLGNQGATGTGILETSHTAIHTWDEQNPALFHFDLYSCSDFEVENILTLCQCFDIIGGNYIVLDRNARVKVIEEGDIAEDGVIVNKTQKE